MEWFCNLNLQNGLEIEPSEKDIIIRKPYIMAILQVATPIYAQCIIWREAQSGTFGYVGNQRNLGFGAGKTFVACVFLDPLNLYEEHVEVIWGYLLVRMNSRDVKLVSFHENLKIFWKKFWRFISSDKVWPSTQKDVILYFHNFSTSQISRRFYRFFHLLIY